MTLSGWKRLHNAKSSELHAPAAHNPYNTEGVAYSDRYSRTNFMGDRDETIQLRDLYSAVSPSTEPSLPILGKSIAKKRFHILHVLAASLSLICFALAIATVANERISWWLGLRNYQLIVVGFLLSIMNLSLASVSPTLFLLLEARFGPSSLQNYEGIIRNQILSSRLSFVWRLVMALMLALPLALSAAYKDFAGGESAIEVNPRPYIGKPSYYGMFAPPGLQLLGKNTGVSLFFNATLPFAVASSSQNGSEPLLPIYSQAYGFNILLLNNESTAMLDIPRPSYISAVQKLLAGGEAWNITAPVMATVATFNHSKTEDPEAYGSFFNAFCENATESSGAYTHLSMMNNWATVLLDHASPGDQSLQYIGFTPDEGIDDTPPCDDFAPYAKLYDINRQLCRGTWSISRGGIQLVDGSCNGTILQPEKQLVVTNNTMFLGIWYMSPLVEFLGPFATTRKHSSWTGPYMATGMAAMLWSRITALSGAANPAQPPALPRVPHLTYEDAGLLYPVNDTVIYIRPTLRKSVLLYCVFAIQPLLTVVILGLGWMFYSTPLDKGFGLISILSGIDRSSLDIVAGAALSGELARNVKLHINTVQKDDETGAITYHLTLPSTTRIHDGRITPDIIYH